MVSLPFKRKFMKYALNSPTDRHRIWNENRNINYNQGYSNSNPTEENKYSGNDAINDYVIATKESNQNISRAALAKLPYEYQKPIFNSLSNENKLRIFIEKINLLINNENLSAPEINHLKSLLTFVKPEYYNGGYDNLIDQFFVNWANFAMNNFNWDKDKVGSYIMTFLSPNELKNINHGTRKPNYQTSFINSDCSKDSDWCFGQSCGSAVCRPTGYCGTFLLKVCDGQCQSQSSSVSGYSTTDYFTS